MGSIVECNDQELYCYENPPKFSSKSKELSFKEPEKFLKSNSANLKECEIQSSKKTVDRTFSDPKAKPAALSLIKLWFVLVLTLIFAVVLFIASNITHSYALSIEAYHAIYNLMALAGWLVTIKICERSSRTKNTYGWDRIELMSCLCTLIFIASFCCTIGLEAIQRTGHQPPMRYPLLVIGLGGIGLVLNLLVFYLIGGYSSHQSSFLEQENKEAWDLNKSSGDAVQSGTKTPISNPDSSSSGGSCCSYDGLKEIMRDTFGLFIVILCALVVLLDTQSIVVLYIDPALAMISAAVLIYLSWAYGRECVHVMLQTIPGHIDVDTLSAKILHEFTEIVNLHHIHIWSLTPGKAIVTVHVVYSDPSVYRRSVANLEKFFYDMEITQVTLQPEFIHFKYSNPSEVGSKECLLNCENDVCHQMECCFESLDNNLEKVIIGDQKKTAIESNTSSSNGKSIEAALK